ncbi:DNA-binding transcriptional LysR family regulator [Aeromonas hydrophila]|uniref:LysR family transcriptional regulator n=1 Tax=Aeromonas hydrophila TaxID=644 RepID=UPI0021679F68|nr:LysR family transcriptional regulator [Aeromonas hydrophila]MCS3766837.1 DNA-binding transcriptional LysR family regulator [Aeromonas hydrophila]
MSKTMINELRSITTFVHTAELGSLSKAAEAQQISPQAASKALGQLEAYLGVRLFHRTTRSMSLTEEGQRFLEASQPALLGLQQALTAARQTREEFRRSAADRGPAFRGADHHRAGAGGVLPALSRCATGYPAR